MTEQIEQEILVERTLDIESHCKDCIFATTSNSLGQQDGCHLGRLDKYVDSPHCETEIVDGSYIIKTFCNMCRSPEWAKKKELPSSFKNLDIANEVAEVAYKEGEIQYDAVFVDGGLELCANNDVKFYIKECIEELAEQSIQPKNMVFVINARNHTTGLHDHIQSLTEIPCFTIVNLDSDNNYQDLVLDGIKKCTSTFYIPIPITNRMKVPTDLFEKLNNAININLDSVIAVEDDKELYYPVIQRSVHKMIPGYHFKVLEDIKALAENQDRPDMIKKYGDL